MKRFYFLIALLLIVPLAACGPSAEQQATMTATAMTATAAAWTPTPTPTNTSTPTATPTPTPTPTPTLTPTVTSTPTVTPDPDRYYAADNSFSFIPPKGWKQQAIGLAFPAFYDEGSTTILIIMEVQVASTFEDLAASFKSQAQTKFGNVKTVSEDVLTTNGGQEFFRLAMEVTSEGVVVRQTYYIFVSGNWTLFILSTSPTTAGTETDALVDAALKSVIYNR